MQPHRRQPTPTSRVRGKRPASRPAIRPEQDEVTPHASEIIPSCAGVACRSLPISWNAAGSTAMSAPTTIAHRLTTMQLLVKHVLVAAAEDAAALLASAAAGPPSAVPVVAVFESRACAPAAAMSALSRPCLADPPMPAGARAEPAPRPGRARGRVSSRAAAAAQTRGTGEAGARGRRGDRASCFAATASAGLRL
eukprot:SAG22_NODE_2306_length_2735_cov_3.036798_4_plen_195_part_00